MEVIFLGTGTSQGVPMIACDCPVCLSSDPRNRRTRPSVHVVVGGTHIQVDAAPEFREQCLRCGVTQIDFFILTHGHADHILGMDDLRRFCDLRDFQALPVYGEDVGLARVRSIYPYAVRDRPLFKGYPAFALQPLHQPLTFPGGSVTPTLLPHGAIEVLGLIFEETATGRKFTYYTDCKEVGPAQRALARGSDAIVLDGLRPEPHPTHMSIEEAVEVALDIAAPQTYLTHLTHAIDHAEWESRLPPGIRLAYDGLRLHLD